MQTVPHPAGLAAAKNKPVAAPKETKPEKAPPRVFPCGCSEAGGRCPEEGRLFGWLEASLRWGTATDQARARQDYHGHFDAGRRELHQEQKAEWAKKAREAGTGT